MIKNALTQRKYDFTQPKDGQDKVEQVDNSLTTLGECCKDGYKLQPMKGALTRPMDGHKRGPKKY